MPRRSRPNPNPIRAIPDPFTAQHFLKKLTALSLAALDLRVYVLRMPAALRWCPLLGFDLRSQLSVGDTVLTEPVLS